MLQENINSSDPDETFAIGERLAGELRGGDVVLMRGGLGAGKTLLTKGIVHALGYDVDEVTSPSFSLVNLYKTAEHNIYHIDLWRISEGSDAAFAVGLDEILEDQQAIVIIEWAERLGGKNLNARVFDIVIEGDGDDPRKISITRPEQMTAKLV
ncbi:MAG: tRNA (adenosine(37)-N6)-threonylcarbamoyltransferase complex ATPase subunit type 1 TsaE [Acidobacteria bacterium]|nr:tRNA (adenosine(37)-N6)-threonylcarbamoyltransferase complex ATPase subunit type 1 TsaE [Acidobacteriota bacterium]